MLTKEKKVFFIFLILVFAIFGHTLHYHFFIFDDASLVYENLHVQKASFQRMLEMWSISNTPIIYNVWQVISAFFGVEAALPFRFFNIFLHGINTFLVYLFTKEALGLFLKKDIVFWDNIFDPKLIERASFLASLAFLLHPVQVESVVWISSLKEILATTFGLLSFLFFFQDNKSPSKLAEIGTIAFYVIGMLVHPTIATLPLVYIWLDFVIYKKDFKSIFFKNGIYFLLLISAVLAHKTLNPEITVEAEQPIYLKIAVALNALFEYQLKALFPTSYSFDYMTSPTDILNGMRMELAPKVKVVASCFMIWGLVLSVKKIQTRFLHYSASLLTLLVLVNLGFVGYAFQNISTIADRFLYFPLIGFSLFISFLYLLAIKYFKGEKKRIFPVFIGCYLLFFLLSTIQRTYQWRSSEILLKESISTGKESYPLHISLGVFYLNNKNYEKAIENFKQAYQLSLSDKLKDKITTSESLSHLFKAYYLSGDKEEGLILIQKLEGKMLNLTPDLAMSLAQYLVSVNQWNSAKHYVDLALMIEPNAQVLKELKVLIDHSRKRELIKSYMNLGIEEIEKRNFQNAQLFLNKALKLENEASMNYEEIKRLLDLSKQ